MWWGLLTICKMMDDDNIIVIVHLHYMVTTSLTTMWPGSLVGLFVTLRPWRAPSSFFVGTRHRVLVMWVLAVDRPLAVDGGGAVLVGWVVISVWVCLPYAKGLTMNDDNAAYRMQKDKR